MSYLRHLLLNNLWLKLLSLGLGFLLWFQVASQQEIQRSMVMPVDLVNLPSNLTISNTYENSVTVDVRARRDLASEIVGLSVVIDLRDAEPGLTVQTLGESNIPSQPGGLEVVRITPAVIRLDIEEKVESFIRVEADLVGTAAPDYEIVRTVIVPAEVRVQGPRSVVDVVGQVSTVPISVSGRVESFDSVVDVFLDDDRVRVLDNPTVQVLVHIEEKRKEIVLSKVPVEIRPPDAGATLRTTTVEVVGTVPISFEIDLDGADFLARVSTVGLEVSSTDQEAAGGALVVPEEYQDLFRLVSMSPVRVRKRR